MRPSNFTLKYLTKRNENIHSYKDLYVNIYSSIFITDKKVNNSNAH